MSPRQDQEEPKFTFSDGSKGSDYADPPENPLRPASQIPTWKIKIRKIKTTIGKAYGWLTLLLFVGVGLNSGIPFIEDHYVWWKEGNPDLKVWVNPNEKIYYSPKAMEFGNTDPGFFTNQLDAREKGDQSTNSWNVGYGYAARVKRSMPSDELNMIKATAHWWDSGLLTMTIFNESSWDLTDLKIKVTLKKDGRTETKNLNRRISAHSEGSLSENLQLERVSGAEWSWTIMEARGFVFY